MKHPQVVICEKDGRLAQLLREPVQQRRWALREPRRREGCLSCLRETAPSILVVKLGPKVEQDLSLLERAQGLIPEVGCVVVGDLENPSLAEAAWDLGASFVLFPPIPHAWPPEIVTALMDSRVARLKQEAGATVEPSDAVPANDDAES